MVKFGSFLDKMHPLEKCIFNTAKELLYSLIIHCMLSTFFCK